MYITNGIATIESDLCISKWVRESGRLDHDQNMLPLLKPFIPLHGVVFDIGAFIGDHTIFYSNRVGDKGKDDPSVHPQRPTFVVHGYQVLGIRKVAMQVEHQVCANVVVAIDHHGSKV